MIPFSLRWRTIEQKRKSRWDHERRIRSRRNHLRARAKHGLARGARGVSPRSLCQRSRLLERLRRLLAAHDRVGKFLEHEEPAPGAPLSPAAATAENCTQAAGADTCARSEKPGDRIGRYKLLQQIGEGG